MRMRASQSSCSLTDGMADKLLVTDARLLELQMYGGDALAGWRCLLRCTRSRDGTARARLPVQLTQSGWEREDAIIVVAVFTVMRMPLAWALRDVIGPRWSGARAATVSSAAPLSPERTRSRTIHTTRRISPAFKRLLPATPFPLSPLCMRA